MPRRRSATAASRITAAQRTAQALELRLQGLSYAAIASRIGICRQRAYQMVSGALAEIRTQNAEAAEDLRTLEAERLDAIYAAMWPAAERGDATAARVCLQTMDRRAKLFGLDAKNEAVADLGAALTHFLVQAQEQERAGDDS